MEQLPSCVDSSSLSDSTQKENSIKSLSKSNNKTNNKKTIFNKNNIINDNLNNNNNRIKEENSLINDDSNIIESPLFQAIHIQNINLIIDLLNKGENPNISLIDGMTPLHLAINKKNEIIIEYLLKNNANPNSKTIIEGQTPVHCAAINNCNKEILKLLFEYGGNFEIEDNNKKTALDYINNIETYDYIMTLINQNKKQYINNEDSSFLYTLNQNSTENDIINNNNTIYTDSTFKKENKNYISYKEYCIKYKKNNYNNSNNNNNIKRDLSESFNNSFISKKDQETKNNIKNNNKNKENINPNYSQEESSSSSIINNRKISRKLNKQNKLNYFKKVSNKKEKKKTNLNLTLNEMIQKNSTSKIYSDINLSNITKINNKPKILFDSIFNINNDIKHRKTKSINNKNFISRFNINSRNSMRIKSEKEKDLLLNNFNKNNNKAKIFDNNDIIRLINNEENTSLNKNNNINKDYLDINKNDKKRQSLYSIKKHYGKKDSIISNISKINQKEEFSISKIDDINDENISLYSNANNNNSNLRKSKKGIKSKFYNHSNSGRNNSVNSKKTFYNNYPIYYWLKDISLLSYYNIFIENNIFDFNKLIFKLKKGEFILTKEDLQKIGIDIPGHIYRIIIKLEIDSGTIRKDISNLLLQNNNYNIFLNSIEGVNDSGYYCFGCSEQNDKKNIYSNNIISEDYLELESWLNKIGLIKYRSNFIDNGFDIFGYFILQMFSSIPIDENILKEDLGIQNENDIDIILLQLNKDVKYILSKIKHKEKMNKKKGIIKPKGKNKTIDNNLQLDCEII